MKKSLVLLLIFLSSCTNTGNIIAPVEQTISISSFSPQNIENKSIGNINKNDISLSSYKGTSFKNEKDAVNFVLDQQKSSSLFDKKSYSIIAQNNSFYPYEIKKDNSSNFKEYQDLRTIKLKNSSDFKIDSIITQKGKVRFYNINSISNFSPAVAKTPEEIIARLKSMENEFAKTKDHRGIFATTYRVISEKVDKSILKYRQNNKNEEAEFLEKLMLNFANKYFYAHDLYFSGNIEKTPEVWRMAFDSGHKSECMGIEKYGNIAEILALSMNAHIIHDLSFSLKELNYDPNNKMTTEVFDEFNTTLFEEKDNIVKAIANIYGKNIVTSASNFFGSVGSLTVQPIFNLMRKTAKNQAEFSNKEQIISRSVSVGDTIMKVVLGGNNI